MSLSSHDSSHPPRPSAASARYSTTWSPLRLGSREIADCDFAAALAVFDSNVPDYFTVAERAAFASFLRQLPGPYFIVEAAGEGIVACGGYAVVAGEGRGDLCWGMVKRDLHGRGIGRFLTALRLRSLRADPRVRSVVLNTSHLTREFYHRLGFVTEKTSENGFGPGLHRCDMRLSFD